MSRQADHVKLKKNPAKTLDDLPDDVFVWIEKVDEIKTVIFLEIILVKE